MHDERDDRKHAGDTRDGVAHGDAELEDGGVAGNAHDAEEGQGAPMEEVDVLRRELARMREALDAAHAEIEELKDRALRARADADTARRRAQGEVDRARDAGVDAALTPALSVYDDLGRALAAAEGGDAAAIVPGVRAVREALERQLGVLGVERVGIVGEPFDPDRHEALTAIPTPEGAEPGTIADVFAAGFVRGERLIRPARVVVYADGQG
jgi:molecular chaperone GrpE